MSHSYRYQNTIDRLNYQDPDYQWKVLKMKKWKDMAIYWKDKTNTMITELDIEHDHLPM